MKESLAIECIETQKQFVDDMTAEAIDFAISAIKKQEADGCQGCAFSNVEEWEMPCAKCRRACKDYWRPAKDERL